MKNLTSNSQAVNSLSDKALWIASGAMFLFVASFFWVALQTSNAAAEASIACNGTDLVKKYASDDPALLAQMRAEAATIANGKNIFWKIDKAGLPASWLLGTMHMADERIAKLDGNRLDAFEKSQILVVESTEALDPQKAQAAMIGLKHLTFLSDGTTLKDYIDPGTLAKLKPAIEARGIPFQIANMLKPWVIATSIALPACEMFAKASGKPVLDALLAQNAVAKGKKMAGLETIEEQFTAIATLPQEFHITALKETLTLGDTSEDIIETMKQLYIDGDIAMVLPLMKIASPETGSAGATSDFQEELIVKRNVIMAKRSTQYLDKGAAFIAVGALHLPGEKGLVELFRGMGYTVTAVN